MPDYTNNIIVKGGKLSVVGKNSANGNEPQQLRVKKAKRAAKSTFSGGKILI